MRNMDKLVVALSVGVLGISGIALAQISPGGYPPGWEWGRENCGPVATPQYCTLAECRACCQLEYDLGWETQTWRDHCWDYCNVVNWSLWDETNCTSGA